jgi:carbamoyl-phosphate synthase large subunit
MTMPKFSWVHKVLVLGSGAIKIGEAAEFDYSGSQCLKALAEEGVETVLVNPNIATIQTDPQLAGKVYLLPLTQEFLTKVIEKEKPDAILLGFGGQTALNCGVQLEKSGVLAKHGVRVLGTPVRAIEDTEDRELFKQAMIKTNVPVPRSKSATSVEESVAFAKEIGYPVIIRVAYTLGGRGSGVAHDEDELREIVNRALAQSMISQVLVEEYLNHWKEIEYEVVRDAADNCLTVCNMENIDPMGIHTGDSIVVAPSQTLSNCEYHVLRLASINAIKSLGIIGECNIQWALNPHRMEFRAIEVNARMSRSSALASKATGYPLAYIAAKLAIGYLLPELMNKVTKVTTACFEPALDYVVVKFPRWDLQKFKNVDRHLGPQMKSVGEVMAIGRCLEEALQKAIRMLDIGKKGLTCNLGGDLETTEMIKNDLTNPTDERFFKTVRALKAGVSIEEIYELTGIDPFFLYKVQNVIDMENRLRSLDPEDSCFHSVLREAKRLGFSDDQIAVCTKKDEMTIREIRKKAGIVPVVKQIDTLAAEWPAKTNYLYLTYGGDEDDIDFESGRGKIVVLGAGVFRIGSSVEFDWCGVNTVWALKKNGVQEAIMVNCNPETVSTDYDTSDKLYFEELTVERILDICEKENPVGLIGSVGGQTPNNLALQLTKSGINLMGTSASSIDRAEDRAKFSALLDSLGIRQPDWKAFSTIEELREFADIIGYPVLVRPSYVLSGSAMKVAYSPEDLKNYVKLATLISSDHPVVISKFLEGAGEFEVDGISDGEDLLIGAIIEHVENAGVHSGDATMRIPAQTLKLEAQKTIEWYTEKIVKALEIKGPFNVQYLVKDGVVYVIECNLRASRSMPYVSKTRGINLIEIATRVMLGQKLRDIKIPESASINHVGVKVPQFSFLRLTGADPVLGVEMLSTGEVACLGENFEDALSKALNSADFKIPRAGGSVLITVGGQDLKKRIIPLARELSMKKLRIYATEHTAGVLGEAGIANVSVLHKVREPDRKPNITDFIRQGKIDLVINIPALRADQNQERILKDEYTIRRLAIEFNIPVLTNLELAFALTSTLDDKEGNKLTIRSLDEYFQAKTPVNNFGS